METKRRAMRLGMGRRSVKLYDPATRRYRPAEALRVSPTGLLLEVRGGLPEAVGRWIGLFFDRSNRRGLCRSGEMLPAVVVRCEQEEGAVQRVAVRITRPSGLAQAA